MIVGFSQYSRGGGRGPVDYVTSKYARDPATGQRVERETPPVVLRGDPEQTRQLIDSLPFEHKYASGVLSFAPGERVTPVMETAIMDRFEQTAFPGLEKGQYDCLWVRHAHAGHHELHFVIPRVELESGKS